MFVHTGSNCARFWGVWLRSVRKDAHHAACVLCSPRAAEALAAVVEATKDGAKVVDLCRIGDDVITK